MAKRWCLPAKFPRALRAIDVVCTSSRQWLLRLCALRCNTFEDNKLKLMCRHEAWEKTHRSIAPSWSRRHKSGGGSPTGRRRIGIAASCARCIHRAAAKRRGDRAQRRLRTQRRTKRQGGKRRRRRGRRRRDRGHDGDGQRRRMPEQSKHSERRARTRRPVA